MAERAERGVWPSELLGAVLGQSRLAWRNDAHVVPASPPVILHLAIRLGVESVVAAPAHQRAWMDPGSSLPHKDGPS